MIPAKQYIRFCCISACIAFAVTHASAQSAVCAPLQVTATIDCATQTAQLSADTNYTSYQWTPSTGLSNDTISGPVASMSGMYSLTANYFGPNLIVNPDFAAGNSGFTSGMNYSSFYTPCNYWVGPQWFVNYFPGLLDHTPTADNMFLQIDGCTTPTMIWEEGALNVVPGADYEFSFWASEAGANQPTYEIYFIGNVTGQVLYSTLVGIPAPATATTLIWDQYTVPTWNAGANTSLTIRIVNTATQGYGVDFGMDDFLFRRICTATETVQVTLPTIVDLGADTSDCDVSGITLDAGPGGSYLWNTGATTQTITPGVAGTYWVTYDDGICVSNDTVVITALPLPVVNLGPDTAMCDVTLALDAGQALSYLWNTGATTQTIQVTAAGVYSVVSSSGTCSATDTIVVSALPVPLVNLGPDISLCAVTYVQLDGGAGSSYLWNTGDTTQTIAPTAPGTYTVISDNGFCVGYDTIELTQPAITLDLGEDISMCDYFQVTLNAGTADHYAWSTGETSQMIFPSAAGTYAVTTTTGMCVARDTIVLSGVPGENMVYVPNTITPDGNSLNDVFYVYGTEISDFRLRIFDRWGMLIYESEDQSAGWDGTFRGEVVQEDTYVYVVDFKTTCNGTLQKRTGHVNVVR